MFATVQPAFNTFSCRADLTARSLVPRQRGKSLYPSCHPLPPAATRCHPLPLARVRVQWTGRTAVCVSREGSPAVVSPVPTPHFHSGHTVMSGSPRPGLACLAFQMASHPRDSCLKTYIPLLAPKGTGLFPGIVPNNMTPLTEVTILLRSPCSPFPALPHPGTSLA